MRPRSFPDHEPLLTVRAALIFLLGSLTGACAGLLTARGGATLPAAFLTAGVAFPSAVMFFRTLIAAAPPEPCGDRPGPEHVRPGEGDDLLPSQPHPAFRPGTGTNSRTRR